MKRTIQLAATLAAVLLSSSSSAAAILKNTLKAPNDRFVLNARQALIVADAASAKAAADDAPSTIVVSDPYGFPIAILRMDNAYVESVDTCIRKTRTVSLFNGALTSGDLNALVQPPGAEDYGLDRTNGGLLAVAGAVPLFVNGTLFAAVGVCGGTGRQDVDAATAGVLAVGGSLAP